MIYPEIHVFQVKIPINPITSFLQTPDIVANYKMFVNKIPEELKTNKHIKIGSFNQMKIIIWLRTVIYLFIGNTWKAKTTNCNVVCKQPATQGGFH